MAQMVLLTVIVGAEVEYKNGKAFSGYIYDYNGTKTKMTNAHFNNLGLEY